jgi:hypothetical protein
VSATEEVRRGERRKYALGHCAFGHKDFQDDPEKLLARPHVGVEVLARINKNSTSVTREPLKGQKALLVQ